MKNRNLTVKEYIRRKALGISGLIETGIDSRVRDDRLTFVNNIDEVQKNKLKEYNVWYSGDSDELINFYTRASTIDYNTDPLYNRNKKSYFWAVSTTENDIKRSHSGMPRNIVDTLSNIVGIPRVGVGCPDSVLDKLDKRLKEILVENDFAKLLVQKSRPFTLVEGWGAWKINWDSDFSDTPLLVYYRADAVDFIYRSGRLVAIIYKDYYQDADGKNYILFETRRIEKRNTVKSGRVPCLIIEKDLFRVNGDSEILTPMPLKDLPQLRDVVPAICIENFNRFLGYPCIFYEDSTEDCYGRSIFTGKIDLFDDEDQCHSQAANAVRRSTVHEYFDVNYLERDSSTGMPKMPKVFDRKYIQYAGRIGGDGAVNSSPVIVTQPAVDFGQYSAEEQNILLNIINGIMSPATLGIDIAKKDNADAQREKEKVTIFTRNIIIEEERKSIVAIANDLLCADELMHRGELTCRKYDVYCQYDEFADASFESKMEVVMTGWQGGIMSDEMAVDYLYGDSISKEIRDRELKFIKEQKEAAQADENQIDAGMFGELGAENDYNTAHEKVDVGAVQEDEGVPELSDYGEVH